MRNLCFLKQEWTAKVKCKTFHPHIIYRLIRFKDRWQSRRHETRTMKYYYFVLLAWSWQLLYIYIYIYILHVLVQLCAVQFQCKCNIRCLCKFMLLQIHHYAWYAYFQCSCIKFHQCYSYGHIAYVSDLLRKCGDIANLRNNIFIFHDRVLRG